MKRVLAIALASAFLTVSVATAKEAPPQPGQAANFSVPETTDFTLDNGLNVTLVPYGNTPKATIRLISKVGNAHDSVPGIADIAYNLFAEDGVHPATQGSAGKAASMGGEINTTVTMSYSYINLNVLSEHTPSAVQMLSELVLNYSPEQVALERVSSGFIRNISIQKSSPGGQATEVFSKAMFGDHPYGAAFPTEDDMKNITVEAVGEFVSNHLVAANSYLYVSGVFDQAATRKAIEDAFAAMNKGTASSIPATEAKGAGEVIFVDRAGAPQSTLRYGLHVPGPENDDFVKLSVMNSMLGGSFSSRITSNIREDKGYTYSPFSQVNTLPGGSRWYQSADVTAEHTGNSMKEIIFEIERLKTEPVSDEELNGFKNYMSGIFVLQNSSRTGIINQLWFHKLHNLPVSRLGTLINQINAVSGDDIKSMAQTYLSLDKMTLVVVGDPESVPEQVRALPQFKQ